PRELELALAALELTAGQIHGIAQIEGRDVDDEFLRLLYIEQRMAQAAVEVAAVRTEHHGRRRVADAVEEAERREVGPAVLVHRADPADRPRHNAGRERIERQTVIVLRRLIEHEAGSLQTV